MLTKILLHDLINLEFTIVAMIAFLMYLRVNSLKSALIVFHLLTIFLLNGVLFPESYFWDQRTYVKFASHFRDSLDIGPAFNNGKSVGIAVSFFGFFPMPFIDTVRSVAMINFLLFLGMFTFAKKKIHSSNSIDYFLLLYPSLLLYSSLALRDTLVLVFMFLSIYYLVIRKNLMLGFFLSLPLIPLKIQNFLIIYLTLYLTMLIFGNFSRGKKLALAILPLIIFITIGQLKISRFTLGEYFTIEKIEFYRYAFFAEQYNYNFKLVSQLEYNPIDGIWSLILLGIKSFFTLLLKPFPWQATNPLRIVQSIENLFIFGIVIYFLFRKCSIESLNYRYNFMKVMLIISMGLNGLVVFNYGSAVRAKFTFIVIYLVLSILLLQTDRKLSKQYLKGSIRL